MHIGSVNQIIDDHAPLKIMTIRNNQIPYMNCQLRKAINLKNFLQMLNGYQLEKIW